MQKASRVLGIASAFYPQRAMSNAAHKHLSNPTVHVLLGKPASGKTLWALENCKQECYGFDLENIRQLLHSTTLDCIAITSSRTEDLEAEEQAVVAKTRSMVQQALEGHHQVDFEVSVIRFSWKHKVCRGMDFGISNRSATGININGFGPDQEKHFGVGNPEWHLRYDYGNRREHAPGDLCLCRRNSTTGKLGTYVLRVHAKKNAQGVYVTYPELCWENFSEFQVGAYSRLCCMGYQMNVNGAWETADGVSIQVDTKRKIARSRLRKWARSVKARPYALHWIEEHAKRVEEKRIAEVDKAVERGEAYDPIGI